MQKQSKSFNLTLKNSKAYGIILEGFLFATSLFFRIRFKITQSYLPSFIMKAVTTINLRRVRLVISQMKLIANMVQTINLRRVRIIASMKQIMKAVSTITLRIPITFVSKAIQKLVSIIVISKIQLLADPTIALFFTLGYYDPDTLGDWDAETLGTMDYSEV